MRKRRSEKNERKREMTCQESELPRLLPGRIVYINRAHRWFLVEADLGDGVKVRECFKF